MGFQLLGESVNFAGQLGEKNAAKFVEMQPEGVGL